MFHLKKSIMSKKFTSFLVLAAALLLSAPSQAQVAKKASRAQVKAFKTAKLDKQALQKAKDAQLKANEAQVEAISFQAAAASQQSVQSIEEAKALKAADKTVGKALRIWNWAAHATPQFVPNNGLAFNSANAYRTISASQAEALLAKQVNNGKRNAPRKVEADPDYATITLTAGDVWGDGTGYQMLLDADATAFGTIIPETGGLTTSGDAAEGVYDNFEYKIPENADGSLTTSNIVLNNSITIKIPEGTYDYAITNPTPGDRIWIASSNSDYSRYNDYVFEKGHVYEFTVALSGNNDLVSLSIDGEPTEEPVEPAEPVTVPYYGDFTQEATIADYYLIDANGDGKTWSWSSTYGIYYSWNSASNADDYVFLPVQLEAGKNYNVTVTAAAGMANYPEKFEVKIGKTASVEGFDQTIIPETTVATATDTEYEGVYYSEEAGVYYLAIHATSDADMYQLRVKKLVIEEGADASAPAAVENFTAEAASGELAANIAFNAPTKSLDGADLAEGDITKIEILRDGSVIKTFDGNEPISWVAANAGYANSDPVTTFTIGGGVTAEAAKGSGSSAPAYYNTGTSLRLYANNTLTIKGTGITKIVFTFVDDAKLTDANLTATGYSQSGTTGTWSGAAASEVTFTVPSATGSQARIQKIEVTTEAGGGIAPGAAFTYTDDADDLTIGNHTYQVITYGAGIGGKSEEITVFLSTILDVPYSFDLAANNLSTFSVIDNNSDNSTWKWTSANGTYYGYNYSNAADDYLISLPFNLQAGKSYLVTVGAKSYSANYPEKFEVLAGTEPTVEGLNITAISETTVASNAFADFEGEFSVPADGIYYLAIHAKSAANMWNLYVNKLSIEKGAEPTAPAAAELTGEAGAEGALEVNLAFTAPANAVNGSALSGTEDIKIYRDDVLVNTLTGVTPGSAQTWQDTNVEDGKTYTYYIVASNESGDGQKSNKVSVFVGQDTPANLTSLEKTAETATSLTFAWDKVTGKNGGYINTENAVYNLYEMNLVQGYFGYSLEVGDQVGSATGVTTSTFDYAVDEGDQKFQYFGVSAKVGTNETDPSYAYTATLIGAPYQLPVEESFKGKSIDHFWEVGGEYGNVFFNEEESSDNDNASILLTTLEEGGEISLISGKLNLNTAANPTLIFDAKGVGITSVDIYGCTDDENWTKLETVALTEDFSSSKISLESIKGSRYSRIRITAQTVTPSIETPNYDLGVYEYTWNDRVILDNVNITDLYQYNLSVDVTAPKTVQAGDKATVTATVKNIGEEIIESYNITVKAGEKELLNQEVSEPLAMFESKTFDIDYETTIFDEAGDVTITATVTPEVDLDENDNTAETIITIKQSSAAGPENVTAQVEEDGKTVDVAWSAPSTSTEEATEDFEDQSTFAPFSLGGITAENHNGAFGEWTLYDGNGITVYGFQNVSFENSGSPSAWAVFNPAEAGGSFATNYSAHSGEQFLWSFCPADENGTPATDHWLISPSLPGTAQTIKFYAKQISSINSSDQNFYGFETFEVLASSTDNKPESFTKVADYQISSADWTEFTADLPAGTTYFAIRHNSTDIFGLLLDDITYTRGGGEIDRYNIYVDGELVDSTDGTTFNVEIDESGEHTISVSAVYTNGQESAPVSADPVTTTAIDKVTVDGKPVDIYSIDGKLIRKQATTLEGLRGIYVINDKKVIIK